MEVMEVEARSLPPTAQAPGATDLSEEALIAKLAELAADILYRRTGEAQARPGMEATTEPAGMAGDEPRMALMRSLLAQEEKIREETPDFQVDALMRSSPAFRALVLMGEPVNRALEYVEPERAAKRIEEAVLLRIKKRNLRPSSMAAQNPGPEAVPADRFTDVEMGRIDALLKRGQKVYL